MFLVPEASPTSLLSDCSYEILGEAVEKMTDISMHLCHVMSLPQRDYVEGGGATTHHEDAQPTSQPASPGTLS